MTIKTFEGARKAMATALGKIGDGYAATVPPTIWAMTDALESGNVEHLTTMYQDVAMLLPPSMATRWGKWIAKAINEVKFTSDGFEVNGDYATFTLADGFEFSKVPAWYVEVKKASADKTYGWNDLTASAARSHDLLVKLAAGDKPRDGDLSMIQLGYAQAAYRRLIADLADIKAGTYGLQAAPAPAQGGNVHDLPATGTNG